MVWLKGAWEEGEEVGEETECVAEEFVEKSKGGEEETEKEWRSLDDLIGLGYYPRGEILWWGACPRSSIVEEGFL